eukprot:scaffold937_cov181-Cylindrotheca_fusiformis.AAC.3
MAQQKETLKVSNSTNCLMGNTLCGQRRWDSSNDAPTMAIRTRPTLLMKANGGAIEWGVSKGGAESSQIRFSDKSEMNLLERGQRRPV